MKVKIIKTRCGEEVDCSKEVYRKTLFTCECCHLHGGHDEDEVDCLIDEDSERAALEALRERGRSFAETECH
jgi:hypothetical protein